MRREANREVREARHASHSGRRKPARPVVLPFFRGLRAPGPLL